MSRTYRLDRTDGRRDGGDAIVVRKVTLHRLLPCPGFKVIEAIAIELYLSGRRLVVVSAYSPGSNDPLVPSLYRCVSYLERTWFKCSDWW